MSTARPCPGRIRRAAFGASAAPTRRAPARPAAVVLAATLALGGGGCARERDLDQVFEPPRPINRVGANAGQGTRYQLSPDSEVTFSLGSRKRRVDGRVPVVHSELVVDPDDLASTRGRFSVDLSGLRIEEPSGSDPASPAGPSLTEQSLRWLELAPERPVEPDAPDARFARFVIRRIGGLSASSAVEGRPLRRREPGTVLRRVDLRATGELSLHGYRVPYTAALSATFHLPEPARAGVPPSLIELSTREPVRLDLLAHEVVPRDSRGAVVAGSAEELRKGSTHVARASLRWNAAPLGG